MTYVVDEKCIKCKLMDFVEVCPVDCFYEGENMLVIHPDDALIAVFASLNVPLMLFTQIQKKIWKNGLKLIKYMLKSGQ